MTPKNALVLSLTLAGATLALHAGANCDETRKSQSDHDMWNAHGCLHDYFMWHYKAYNMIADDWGTRGFFDACNPDKEYAKHWGAAYLISYGLADIVGLSFHSGRQDYQELAYGRSSREWHASTRQQAVDDTSFDARWVEHTFSINDVQTSCNVYGMHSGPASRAGNLIHEGTHAWLDRHGFNVSHRPPSGECHMTGNNCDYFYFHGLSRYKFGQLWMQDGTAHEFHSPNQTQVEFLCDVADYPASWVPATVQIDAAADVKMRSIERFINGPGYACGTVRPW